MGLDQSELLEHLAQQRDFLIASADAYDRGAHGEAKRLALTVRVLFHQTGASHAVLAQAGYLDRLDMPCMNDEAAAADSLAHLGGLATFDGVGYSPKLGIPARTVPFPQWWSEVVSRSSEVEITRQRCVLNLANQGGGGHVDPRLNNSYREIEKTAAMGWTLTIDDVEHDSPLNHPLQPFMRTIAHEVVLVLREILGAR